MLASWVFVNLLDNYIFMSDVVVRDKKNIDNSAFIKATRALHSIYENLEGEDYITWLWCGSNYQLDDVCAVSPASSAWYQILVLTWHKHDYYF